MQDIQNNLAIYASPLPFSNKQIKAHAVVGSTVQQIVDLVLPKELKDANLDAHVFIGGHPVPREKWRNIKPKEGHLINVRLVPQGGGGGKSPIATLLSIAITIAAPGIGNAIALGLQGTFATGAVIWNVGSTALSWGTVFGAAVGVVGKMLVSALAPPPKPSNAGQISNPAESPTQFIEGAKNSLNPFGVIPICLGTNRMFPLQAARPFTETQNGDQYVRQLFTYGYVQNIQISDLKIGETAISQFSDFDLEHRLNGDLHLPTNLYSNDVFQDDYNVLLQEVDGFTTRTSQADIDELVVDVTFPQGLSQFTSQGARISQNVQLELQFAESGVSPQVWISGLSFTDYSGDTLTVDATSVTTQTEVILSQLYYVGYRRDIVSVNQSSGQILRTKGTVSARILGDATAPSLPSGHIRLATVAVKTIKLVNSNAAATTSILSVTDDRNPSLFGTILENAGDFAVTNPSGLTLNVAAGAIAVDDLNITAAQTEALRVSKRIVLPSNGTYDVRIRRVSADTASDQIFDKVYLTSIKSIKYQSPVVLTGLCGTAVRIKATDQLNGSLDQFNVIASNVIDDYDGVTGEWSPRVTSNPASIYRYVLQGAANARPLDDSKIDIEALEAWHVHCQDQGYTYNRVIDYETSVDEVLRDVAAAGSASPAIVDGKRTIVIDKVKPDIVQIVTPRNSWNYNGEMVYPDLPHAFRVQFRNSAKGYQQDERIVYDDGFNEGNATKFEALELQSCTNSDLAFKTGRRHIATARLRPETHTFMMDVENLVAIRGDRIKLVHDIPLVGIGDGRIKSIQTSGGSPDMVTGITVDDTISIPTASTYFVRIRLSDGTFLYKQVNASVGNFKTFTFTTPFSIADTPSIGDLCYFVEAGGELDLIITRIEPADDLTARVTCVNYAPEIFDAENSPIPAFESKITTPLEFIRPQAPILLNEQSDEDVMLINSDGTYTPRAIFTLENPNDDDVFVSVKIRQSGTNQFTNANVLEATPDRVILTGLQDNTRYDIHIRYRRAGSNLLSLPLQLNNYLFVGVSGLPDDVTGFNISVSGTTAILRWNAVDDIDLSHYKIKFSGLYTGATWETAQLLQDNVLENNFTAPFIGGTYFVKAIDYQGNESENSAVIVTYNPGTLANAVAVLNEAPAFNGTKDNVTSDSNSIVLADPDLSVGYYYFDNAVDLDGIFTSFVSASIVAGGAFINDVFDFTDIFAESDIFGGGNNNVFALDDLFTVSDVFGIGSTGWAVTLQYRTTNDDPTGTPTWSAWQDFQAGNIEFWGAEFRLKLESFDQGVSPQVTGLSVTVDMPDRIERGEDLTVGVGGTTITFEPAFKDIPAVAITLQDAATDDRIEFTSKTPSGFSFFVYNGTTSGNVARTYDFIASGYGREN